MTVRCARVRWSSRKFLKTMEVKCRKRTDLVRRGLECGWNDRWVELSGLLHDVAGVAAGEGRNV